MLGSLRPRPFSMLGLNGRAHPLTLVPSDTELKHLGESALVRLSSFPELTPHPIIETTLEGSITYINPAAVSQFPDLRDVPQHPLLQGLVSMLRQQGQAYCAREVQVGDRIYEQSIHCIPQSQLIRSYLVDVTQRKRAEEVLRG